MTPRYTIINADILEWAESYKGEPFHCAFGDWPYNLESISRRFGKPGSKPAKYGKDGSFARASAGFMNQDWDQPLAYQAKTWELLACHLLPGAFTASFSHVRTQHRLATAQEDAGYLINPAIYNYHTGQVVEVPAQLGWIYGSGKPNGTDVSKAVDRREGAEREVTGPAKYHSPGRTKSMGTNGIYNGPGRDVIGDGKWESLPATPLAQTWDGWQYGAPLKPEIEPIIIAQKPYDGKPLDSITKYGAGAYNIAYGQAGKPRGENGGGFPGTLVLSHHPGCKYEGLKVIKNESGGHTGEEPSQPADANVYNGGYKRIPDQPHGDESGYEYVPAYDCHPDCIVPQMESQAGGDKAHYFYQADWRYEVAERLAMANPVYYSGKVTPAERNAGCEELPLRIRNRVNPGGLENEPRFAPTLQQNNHPTLKPVSLCKWIAGLLLPSPEYAPRRILICCSGTGSEMIGALLAGWDEVIGVELKPEYAAIAGARLAWWSDRMRFGATDPEIILDSIKQDNPDQLTLF